MINQVPIEQLRRQYDPRQFSYETTEEIESLESIIGQERAVKALQFGLEIKGVGFNIYVSGMPGTGKTTAVKHFLEQVARDKPVPGDWCYVNNFQDAYRPEALRFPPGQAKIFQAEMRELIKGAKQAIRTAFDSDEYHARREEVMKSLERQRDQLLRQLDESAKAAGFFLQLTPTGFYTIPMREGKPMNEEQFMTLSAAEREALVQRQPDIQSEVKMVLRQAKSLDKQINQQLEALDREVTLYALNHLIEDLVDKYQALPEVKAYLEAVQDDILKNLAEFRAEPQPQPGLLPLPPRANEDIPARYQVNVLVDNGGLQGSPVVIELNPTYNNLFGRIEKEAYFGAMITDFTMIREGCLHRANGGYLVLPVEEVLRNLFAWDSLKRALRNQEIVIEEAGERLGFVTTKSSRPEPIPLDIKVILIGQPNLYYLLHAFDEDFSELFKIKADFDTRMDRTPENIQDYIAFASTLCHDEGLKHLDRTALAKIVEHGSRLAEDQAKLSTKFGDISNVIREASFYAGQEGAPYVKGSHLKQAIEARFYRSSLLHERVKEMIQRNTLLVEVTGVELGQVNGLSVISLGDIAFGQPTRITATTSVGSGGLIDIEREAKLGGPIHTKGILILAGYLAQQYAQTKPLNLSARLVFEQSYGEVEGDSASSAELYALLSSLADVPLKQGIAVTGSVNQKGQIQAIGGVNEKVEGFFEVCQAKGLTGEQGVIIPEGNLKNLMLKEEVISAVQEGMFRIWAVSHINEGLEILTGVKAGQRQADGAFEAETLGYRIDQRLQALAEITKSFSGSSG